MRIFLRCRFAGEDFERLRDTLREVQGTFIVSLNDTPEIREIFGEFTIESIETKILDWQYEDNSKHSQ
jgi:hypothetical protein